MGVNIAQEQKKIEGVMLGLMKELQKLAPHPDRPDHTGPVFVSIDDHIKPAAEYEGMLGSMALETMLGGAFGLAVSGGIDYSLAAEGYSEFIKDRQPKNFKLGQRKAITNGFNQNSAKGELLQAYLRDLPRRLGIEKWLAHYQRKLYALRKQAQLSAFTLAA